MGAMPFLRRYAFWLFLLVFVTALISAPSPKTARTRVADGFDFPVGKPDAEGYYKSRGFRANYHMGDDWNGVGGGNTDLGKPVYSVAHGMVVLARDMRMAWGNLVIIRHILLEEGRLKMVDSVYAHLDRIMVREGQQVVRGQQVGTIGTAHGMYTAHLHFEIRKNIYIGFNQRGFPKDLTSYYVPTAFISTRRKLPGGGRSALIEVDTFNLRGPAASTGNTNPSYQKPAVVEPKSSAKPKSSPNGPQRFRVNRFDDLLSY